MCCEREEKDVEVLDNNDVPDPGCNIILDSNKEKDATIEYTDEEIAELLGTAEEKGTEITSTHEEIDDGILNTLDNSDEKDTEMVNEKKGDKSPSNEEGQAEIGINKENDIDL